MKTVLTAAKSIDIFLRVFEPLVVKIFLFLIVIYEFFRFFNGIIR